MDYSDMSKSVQKCVTFVTVILTIYASNQMVITSNWKWISITLNNFVGTFLLFFIFFWRYVCLFYVMKKNVPGHAALENVH